VKKRGDIMSSIAGEGCEILVPFNERKPLAEVERSLIKTYRKPVWTKFIKAIKDYKLVEEGDKIPADGRLIETNVLKVDNSTITGESEPQLRSLECTHPNILECRNMVFSGTLVQSGNGKAIVFGTGPNTQIGNLAILTEQISNVETPIRRELNHFIKEN